MSKRLNIAALAISMLALFVGLGGTSYAAKLLIGPKNIKINAVTHKKIKAGHVRTSEIQNGGVQMADLAGSLQAQVQSNFELLDGSVTTAKLADNAVTSAKVADENLTSADLGGGSVDSSEIAMSAVKAPEIAGSAVGDSEVASDAIDSNEVDNGGLNAADVGRYAGTKSLNFSSIPAGECETVDLDPTPASENIQTKAALVTPGSGFSGDFSFHSEAEISTLVLKACNHTGADADPDGAGTSYNYIVFG
jgi:hypothetical protein